MSVNFVVLIFITCFAICYAVTFVWINLYAFSFKPLNCITDIPHINNLYGNDITLTSTDTAYNYKIIIVNIK